MMSIADERSRLVLALNPEVQRYTLGQAVDLTSRLLAPKLEGEFLKPMRDIYGEDVANPDLAFGEHCRLQLWNVHAVKLQSMLMEGMIRARRVLSQTEVLPEEFGIIHDVRSNEWRQRYYISRESLEAFSAALDITVAELHQPNQDDVHAKPEVAPSTPGPAQTETPHVETVEERQDRWLREFEDRKMRFEHGKWVGPSSLRAYAATQAAVVPGKKSATLSRQTLSKGLASALKRRGSVSAKPGFPWPTGRSR
jgi:hypothetical protein